MTKHMNPPSERVAARSPLFIRRVDAIPIALPLKKPMKMAGVTIATADNVLVRIEADGGLVGWGEAASAPTMTGDTQGSLVAAIRHLTPLIVGTDAWSGAALMRKLGAALYGNTGAHSAIELALLDLAGRAADLPAINLIGGPLRGAVAPMWLLGNATPADDAAEARARLAEGFRFFKVKVGAKSVEGDIASTLAVRNALGFEVPVCADANCGFRPADARRYVDATRDARLMFLEQPFGPHDLKSLATLARISPIALGADEGIHSLDDVNAHAQAGAAGVSLKLIKLGGISAAVEASRLCARLGLSINVAAKIAETSIASAAAINLACAAPSVDWGVSLTHFYLAHDIVKAPLKIADGLVALPQAPGLGVEVDEDAVARFTVKGG
jgi:muconate cycloisomerase